MLKVLSLLLCLAAGLAAQSGTGTIQGTVKDPAGAVVPGARVKAVHVPTAGVRETLTNDAGVYVLAALPIGPYKLSVEAPGLQPWEGEMLLQVGQAAVVDPVLKLGSTVTEITVAGDVTPLTIESAPTLGQVIERSRIEQLPLNGRFLNSLVGLTIPGVEGQRTFGLREAAMEYVQDGAALVNRDTGGLQGRPPGLDTIQEFKVETNNSSAKVNRPATVIVSTKAGSNQLHGSLFETARNNGLGVARRRQDFYDKPPKLVRNEFGGSLGGPIFLPRLYNGRNKSFFFVSWEKYRNQSSNTTSLSMPTMEIRQGDFSGLKDSLGRPTTLYDPWTTTDKWARTPYPTNLIPITRQSPLAKYLYSVTPAPTHPDRNPVVTSNFYAPIPNNRSDNTFTTRLDHRLSDRDQTFVRLSIGDNFQERAGNEPSYPTLDNSTNITYSKVKNYSGVGAWTHSFSPTFFGETLLNWSYENYDIYCGDYFKNWASMLRLPNPFNEEGFPYIYNTGFGMFYVQPDNRRNNRTWVFGFDQNFTKVAGKHELQFGARFRNERMFVLPDQGGVHGRHYFNSCATCLYDPSTGSSYGSAPRSGHEAANLFLGLAAQYQAVFSQKTYRFRDREFAFYLQDNWKASSRLTVNLGLRYELHPALAERQNLFTGFDMDQHAIVNGVSMDELIRIRRTTPEIARTFTSIGVRFLSAADVGLPTSLTYADRRGFGPRAGIAYKLGSGHRPVIARTGFSLFVYPPPLRNFNAAIRSNPPFQATFTKSFTSAAQSPDGLPNYAMRSAPTVIAGLNSENVIDPTQPGGVSRGGFTTNFFDPHQPLTRVSEWNLTLEREIANAVVARVSYVGNHGFNLEQFQSFNNQPGTWVWLTRTGLPLPSGEYAGVSRRSYDQTTYGEIRRYQKTGYSNFNGVTFEMQRRYEKGYGFQFFYVLSNAARVAGNGWRDDIIPDPSIYLPGAVPADIDQLNRFMNYRRDTDIPHHRLRWNWLIDLPLGRGKWLGRNADGLRQKLIGGWQIAGFGSWRSNYWALQTSNWGATNPIETYGTKYRVEDCRSGVCIPGYLYTNGYIPANRINSRDAQGRPNGVMGVPDNYRPAHSPIIPIPKDGGNPSDPMFAYYDSNNVWITLKNGTVQRLGYDNGLHPWRNQFAAGPWNFGLDASIFKTVQFRERVSLRFNADFFQALNNPGIGQPSNGSGIVSLQNSANGPRQLQLTLRLTF
jgi:hypothetical protein